MQFLIELKRKKKNDALGVVFFCVFFYFVGKGNLRTKSATSATADLGALRLQRERERESRS